MPAQAKDMTRPRVLCVSSYFPEHGGGVERVAHEIAEYFVKQRHWHVTLAASITQGPVETVPARYKRVGLKCWNGVEAMTGLPVILPSPFDLARLLGQIRKFDLIIVHEEIYVSNFLVVLWSLINRVPLIVVKHTGVIPLRKRPILSQMLKAVRYISRLLLRNVAQTVFVTQAKQDNFDPERTIRNALVIPNGIDTRGFALPEKTTPPRKGVIFVGRFIESKGLQILRHITRELSDIPFSLVGWGPDKPEAWQHQNVTVVRRPSRQTIAQMLRQSRLALVPGNGEGIPLVALEALSCGTVTMIGAGSNRIESEVSRHLIFVPTDLEHPEEAAKVWSGEIRKILTQKDSYAAQEARHNAVELKHSTRVMCKAYADLAFEIMASHRQIAGQQLV